MRRLPARRTSSWTSMKQQDCLDLNGHRAGTTPSDLEYARNPPAILKRRRTTEALYPSQDKIRLSRKIPNRKTAITTPSLSSSARKSVKRWDGIQRTTTVWDSLRRDSELWFSSGDCLIHFYGPGQSRRGASLRVSLIDIKSSGFRSFLDHYPADPVVVNPLSAALDSSPDGDLSNASSPDAIYELYVPAPTHLSREDAFRYHLTTRNLFAWIYDLPMVGDRLGEALVSLLERMDFFRPNKKQNEDDMLAYLDSQDYLDFRDCPDHSLALLNYAEACQNRDLWTDAFVHCAGMYDDLTLSVEFESISRPSKALILRAHLEMDLRLEHAGRSLGSFLEDDLSSTYLGLGHEAQAHLERFRCFLHSYYLGKYGYWPPAPVQKHSTALPKSTYRTMYFDFRNLYEYLVDPNSSESIQDNRPADGGICVLQNIKNFDKRKKYASLPHPLPLNPELRTNASPPKPSGMRKLLGKKQSKLDRRVIALTALSAATNSSSVAVMECPLVREYLRFEKSWTMNEPETITCSDARKVRWILIYSILQTLISVTRAPKEVRDTEGVSYPLCCQIAGTPPWDTTGTVAPWEESRGLVTGNVPPLAPAIEPDVDYLTSSRNSSIISADIPLPITVPRKVSMGPNFALQTPVPQKSTSCGILLPGYGEPVQGGKVIPDPSTPGSSADGAASGGGWSSSSSEDGMEHVSVTGNESIYECEEDTFKEGIDHLKELEALVRMVSSSNFRSRTWNPDDYRPISS